MCVRKDTKQSVLADGAKVILEAFLKTSKPYYGIRQKNWRSSLSQTLEPVNEELMSSTAQPWWDRIRSFVEKIEVMKPEKVPGTRTKKQTIVIYWNFIGAVEIPDAEEKTA